ncbi:hypothetical protein CYLTODRAFT_402840 [Cylindrobasidium torrendii FP15055 ss-10]|uniref:Copper acquisition factor BIM1-like domain-containing protein n=1 Tax=Cylindrobasidium torrendii FP15055 ss-10 TaxID=1314674 RepID=A0A0D7B2E0_9AGAR|nr:hypothetical protein CYLTODRAFT_402840 [Cylindrobasidium torrendii FP15055 ss-10]
MKFSAALLTSAALALSVQAHFTLDYPEARGEFDEDNEGKFCGGQTTIGDREPFPLQDGLIEIDSHHPSFTGTVFLSNSTNPTSFDDFVQILPWFKLEGAGTFCLPLDLASTNASVSDGQNVTIQFVYDGGDSPLYQCADLQLARQFTVNVNCTNSTSSSTSQGSGDAAFALGAPFYALAGLLVGGFALLA